MPLHHLPQQKRPAKKQVCIIYFYAPVGFL
nr:MAG TPA: hypothetical protein [Caudoviricetes sp.]